MQNSVRLTKTGITVLLTAGFVLAFALNALLVYPALDNLLDFGSFVAAGRAAAEGGNPYRSDLPLIFRLTAPRVGAVSSLNLNPPITVLIFKAIAGADPIYLVTIWRMVTLLLYGCAVLILTRVYQFSNTSARILWAFSLAGLWHILQLGQIYAPLLLTVVGTWLFLEKGRPILAGITLGVLIAIKPNFVLWAFLLGVGGYWPTFFVAGAISLSLSILPVAVYGLQIYSQWFAAIAEYQPQGLLLPGNNSLQSLLARIGLAPYAFLVSVVFLCTILYLVYQRRSYPRKLNELGIVASLLVSPITWTGYTILCLPLFLAKRKWSWRDQVAAAIFMFPYFMVFSLYEDTPFRFVFFGWFYGWGLVLLLWELFISPRETAETVAG